MTSGAPPSVPLALGVLLTGLGGALGALLRWGVGDALPAVAGQFPWATLAINVSGSAALAALPLVELVRRRPWLPLLVGTGFLGGFTTMSAASVETFALIEAGRGAAAAGYSLGTLLAALAAAVAVDHWARPEARALVHRLEGDR